MKTLAEYLELAATAHGHLCAGQVLGVRLAAKESSKQAAREMFPELVKGVGQQKAYAQLSDDILFDKQWVKVQVQPEDLPGFKGPRVVCAQCGEGINFKREVVSDGRTLCRACAGERYYSFLVEGNSN